MFCYFYYVCMDVKCVIIFSHEHFNHDNSGSEILKQVLLMTIVEMLSF
jgi:hypothetical protein